MNFSSLFFVFCLVNYLISPLTFFSAVLEGTGYTEFLITNYQLL